MNSFRLFNNRLSLKCSIRFTFSAMRSEKKKKKKLFYHIYLNNWPSHSTRYLTLIRCFLYQLCFALLFFIVLVYFCRNNLCQIFPFCEVCLKMLLNRTGAITPFGLRTFVTSTECSTLGDNLNCLKKRRFYTTKVSCYSQSSGTLFLLCSKNNKNICQKQYINKYMK